MQMKLMIAAVSILGLEACNPAATTNDAAPPYESADDAMVANTPVSVPKNALVPETNAVDAVETATVLPVDFQGRWGLVANDCDPARDDNTGLMTVAADTLNFYKTPGVVKMLTDASPTKPHEIDRQWLG